MLGFGSVWTLSHSALAPILLRERGHPCSLHCSLNHSLSTHPPIFNPILWVGSCICFDNTAERFDCASLPRCWWKGSSNNKPSTQRCIKASSVDLMMIEGLCMRVGPPASESCLWVKSTIIQVHPTFDLMLQFKCYSGADVSCVSLIMGQQGQRDELPRCIVLIVMANTRAYWGFWLKFYWRTEEQQIKAGRK